MRHTFIATLSALAACLTMTSPAAADGPTVVELYTSQGCSSCPPADEMLHALADQSDVIALALHVDYWDYIGWADIFADPEHTLRQEAYADVAGSRAIYTPQMIVGGTNHVIGAKPMEVASLIRTHSANPTGTRISLERSGGQLQISGQTAQALRDGTVVQVIRYSPEETVNVQRGENGGRTLSYANIVTEWSAVGEWSGSEDLSMSLAISGDAPVVVIVQEPGPGPVMASAILR